jgi:hypothetical protein
MERDGDAVTGGEWTGDEVNFMHRVRGWRDGWLWDGFGNLGYTRAGRQARSYGVLEATTSARHSSESSRRTQDRLEHSVYHVSFFCLSVRLGLIAGRAFSRIGLDWIGWDRMGWDCVWCRDRDPDRRGQAGRQGGRCNIDFRQTKLSYPILSYPILSPPAPLSALRCH